MEIPRSLLNELTGAVNALSTSAQALAATALDEIFKEWDGADVAGLRVECIEALEAIESAYCDTYAAGKAAEFYEGCRAAQGVRGAYRAVADSRRDPQALAGAVKAMIQYVVNGDTDKYRRECLSRIDTDVRRSANNCVAYNTRRDPKKPRYARVPTGGETCGFYLMLASFGFHYTTEEAASHAHADCDCRVVPSFGKATVKGYDADGMYSRYNDVLETLGGRDGIRAEWNALPKEEREAYIASHGKKEGAAFQKYLNKRVSQEIETRDATWFQTGSAPKVGFASEQVKNRATEAEVRTAGRLSSHGIKSVFVQDYEAACGEDGRKFRIGLPDLDGGIELKTLGTSRNARGAMKNYLENSTNKKGLKVVVVDNSESKHITDEELVTAAQELIGEFADVPHLRLLMKDGSFIRIK